MHVWILVEGFNLVVPKLILEFWAVVCDLSPLAVVLNIMVINWAEAEGTVSIGSDKYLTYLYSRSYTLSTNILLPCLLDSCHFLSVRLMSLPLLNSGPFMVPLPIFYTNIGEHYISVWLRKLQFHNTSVIILGCSDCFHAMVCRTAQDYIYEQHGWTGFVFGGERLLHQATL